MTKLTSIKKVRKCKECGLIVPVGDKTKECLKCLDWKMDDLRR